VHVIAERKAGKKIQKGSRARDSPQTHAPMTYFFQKDPHPSFYHLTTMPSYYKTLIRSEHLEPNGLWKFLTEIPRDVLY
jgi:hypothetical protein